MLWVDQVLEGRQVVRVEDIVDSGERGLIELVVRDALSGPARVHRHQKHVQVVSYGHLLVIVAVSSGPQITFAWICETHLRTRLAANAGFVSSSSGTSTTL